MTVWIDHDIFAMQAQGGISQIWRNLRSFFEVQSRFQMSFQNDQPDHVDVFMPTYYRRAPHGVKSLVLVYDMIAEQYPAIGRQHPDAVRKRQAIVEAARVVAISGHVAADVLRFTGRPVDAVAYPGVSRVTGAIESSVLQDFKAQLTGNKPYVLIVGNRGLYKNVQALYQAWRFFEGRKDFKIVCVGGERELPQDVAFMTGYPDTLVHVALNDADKEVAYAGASMLVYPSMLEGFGMPPLEAYWRALPVVCGECMREVMGNAAVYCDVFRPQDIAAAMNKVLHGDVATGEVAVRGEWSAMAKVLLDTIGSME